MWCLKYHFYGFGSFILSYNVLKLSLKSYCEDTQYIIDSSTLSYHALLCCYD
ncbi:hypothetical protein GLIP_1168 [Aliiglaciecola lipolytica E3]|uniref:Uncharacterized protein n=1 Tax=Aliiglaciecola lipolytica E3 TaxID=1127673 RepID=K6WZI2_9ALTE|nr:hypothetical protein GLIP_1168 [Aliiglaciecola lipolytica E3]